MPEAFTQTGENQLRKVYTTCILHTMATCHLLRKRKTPPGRASYCYEELKSSPELQERFSVEVRNRFAVLDSAIANREDATERYGCLVEAVAQTSKVLLGKKRKRIKDVVAEDFRVKRARESVETASQQYHSTPSEETLEGIGSAKKDLEDAYQIVNSEILESKISKVEDATKHAKTRESWRLVNEISGRHQREQSQIEGDSADDRVEIWYNHFKTLLGTPAEPTSTYREPEIPVLHPPGPIDIGPFTRDELRTAKSRLKEARAFGDDSIPPEVLKRCDIDDIVLGFCNGALNGEGVPDQWLAKTLNRMILHRIRPHVETLLSNNQNGFREGRSTTNHILTLRRILEGARGQDLPIAMVFIDFVKAFDSINMKSLMKILRSYGIPGKIVDLLSWLYQNTKAKVLTADGETALFEIVAGVLQGDTLAPFLFIIALDFCITTALSKHPEIGFTIQPARGTRSRPIEAQRVSDTEFADDLALLADSTEQLGVLLREVEAVCGQIGLHCNLGKTEFLTEGIDNPGQLLSISGESIKRVDDFKYLGSWVANCARDIATRKAKAWVACHKLKKIWNSSLKDELKIRLFVACVESVLLYGCETWTLTKDQERSLNGTYTRMLRMALNKNQYLLKMTNWELYSGLPILSTKIAERRLRHAGHALRHPELTLHSVLLWEPSHDAPLTSTFLALEPKPVERVCFTPSARLAELESFLPLSTGKTVRTGGKKKSPRTAPSVPPLNLDSISPPRSPGRRAGCKPPSPTRSVPAAQKSFQKLLQLRQKTRFDAMSKIETDQIVREIFKSLSSLKVSATSVIPKDTGALHRTFRPLHSDKVRWKLLNFCVASAVSV
eukprot:sb/3462063/